MTRRQSGFGAIMAIIVLVILAGLAAALIRISGGAQLASAQDINIARALAAANAGVEYGVYRALKPDGTAPWKSCTCPDINNSSTCTDKATLDLTADTGFKVLVWCDSTQYYVAPDEGGATSTVTQRILTISALACNATSCPDNTMASSPGYIERKRQASLAVD